MKPLDDVVEIDEVDAVVTVKDDRRQEWMLDQALVLWSVAVVFCQTESYEISKLVAEALVIGQRGGIGV